MAFLHFHRFLSNSANLSCTNPTPFSAQLVANCTLRLLHPACSLAPAWSEEPLRQQTVRSINHLHDLTMTTGNHPLPAPTLAYVLPLLQRALECGGQAVGGNDDIMSRILEILAAHAKCRSKDPMSVKVDLVSFCRFEVLHDEH